MDEIRIYQSHLRMILMTLGCFAFAASGLFFLYRRYNISHYDTIMLWLGVVFFGVGGLVLLYNTFRRILSAEPFMTITAERVTYHGIRSFVVNFADVKSFTLKKVNHQKLIAIHYKPNVELHKMNESGVISRILRSFNKQAINAQEVLSTVGSNMKAQELCDLLNERLEAYNRSQQ
ncbi:MAG: hypothetical protein IJJ77_02245 [Paludibacteraceae bacterium]|nr:hypothetical protein [Paludibacteraceae bacterium]